MSADDPRDAAKPAAALLRRSRHLSFHARGEAAFVWHGLSGDVCEMSADIVQLLLAFDEPREVEAVAAARPGGLDPVDARNFAETLRRRLYLVDAAVEDELAPLREWYVVATRAAIRERRGGRVTVHARALSLELNGEVAAAFLACDGARRLREVLEGREEVALPLLRLCRADVAALKVLPAPAIPGGPAWAESTMPFAEVDPYRWEPRPLDLRAYHEREITDADEQFDERETTLSHLFRSPHEALGGRSFGQALAGALRAEGVAPHPRVLEVGGGTGILGAALREALAPAAYVVVDLAPALSRAQRGRGLVAVRGDARALPAADGVVDLVVANEMAGDLGPGGAAALVAEAARVLGPGGILYLSEFGSTSGRPRRSDHLDHDEVSLRFADLRDAAVRQGLDARVVPLPLLLRMSGQVDSLVTTRASFAALRRLFAAHGASLDKRAWTREAFSAAAAAAGIDLDELDGLQWASAGERVMGLRPADFYALVAHRRLPG